MIHIIELIFARVNGDISIVVLKSLMDTNFKRSDS